MLNATSAPEGARRRRCAASTSTPSTLTNFARSSFQATRQRRWSGPRRFGSATRKPVSSSTVLATPIRMPSSQGGSGLATRDDASAVDPGNPFSAQLEGRGAILGLGRCYFSLEEGSDEV